MSPESAVVWREKNREIFAQTIAAAAEQFSIPQLAVEKDHWVCQALRAIEEHAPGETIFKGGTSLEKQRLIECFSEDIDLLVIGAYESRRAVERALKGMCAAAVVYDGRSDIFSTKATRSRQRLCQMGGVWLVPSAVS